MWTMTPRGFFSAVQHRDDPTLLVVRTRVRADADTLVEWYATWAQNLIALHAKMDDLGVDLPSAQEALPDAEVTTYDWSDYPWRVILPRSAWAAFMAEAVEDLDYGNFKDAVKKVQGAARANVYSGVWSVLLRLESQDPQGRRMNQALDSDWGPYDAWEDEQGDDPDWNDEAALERYFKDRGWV